MIEHSTHIIFIQGFLFLSILILFRERLLKTPKVFLSLISLILFLSFHILPVSLVVANVHESPHGIQEHPCCMPVASVLTEELKVPLPNFITEVVSELKITNKEFLEFKDPHNKSPPALI